MRAIGSYERDLPVRRAGGRRRLTAVLLLVMVGGPWPLLARQATTVWNGVYTSDQAERGRLGYVQHCMYCHHEDLLGGEDLAVIPPALVGATFDQRWQGKSVGELFQTIATTMPWRKRRLEAQLYADILTYILKENAFPAGPRELPVDLEQLRQIQITGKQ